MMKKHFLNTVMAVIWASALSVDIGAQTVLSTQPTFTVNNGSGLVTFNLQNTNSYPIMITDVSTVLNAQVAAEAILWTRPSPVNGPPQAISAANGWTAAATQTVTSTIGGTANTVAEPILTGISVLVPANTTIGVAVSVFSGTTGRMRYTDITAGTNPSFTAGGLTLITGNLIGYATTNPTVAPPNHPRGFTGSLTFVPAIIGQNNAGVSALLSPTNFCLGSQSVQVQLINGGSNIINNVDIHWEIDGVPQPTINYTTPIDTFGSVSGGVVDVTLGNYVFTGAPTNITVYTSNPNGVADIHTGNDTLHAVLQASLSGTYTINSAQPTGGNNYISFQAFINDLTNYGVCGPVIANVDNASGPYNEVLRFGQILGTSAINTIRINGNGREVNYSNTITAANNDRQLLIVNGTKYLTIDNLIFKTLGTNGWGAVYTNGAAYDSLTNCTFDFSSITTTTAANSNGIAFSGSTTSATTAASGVKHCYIGGNRLLGPTGSGGYYHGITLMGADSNTVENNEFSNFYYYGMFISNSTGSKILKNELHRSTKSSVTAFYGIHTVGTTPGTIINANKIHTPAGVTTSTSLVYALNITGESTSQNPSLVSNNLVYDINGGGIIYGIQISAAPYSKIYHNTVVLDKTMTGTSVNRGVYATGNNNGTEVKNNIVSITGGSLGVKTGLFYNAVNSVSESQRNNVCVNSTQTGNQFYAAYPAANTYADMAAFQAAYPALETGSLSGDPQFVNANAGDFLPTLPLLGTNGVNLFADVPADINGTVRKPTPTPGAFETAVSSGSDGALTAFVSPNSIFCEGSQDVSVVLFNQGSAQLSNFDVFWQLNGVTQPPFTYTATLDTISGSGVFMDTTTIGNIVIPSGINTIKAWLAIPGDSNAANDTMSISLTPSNFVATAQSDTICLGKEASLSLSPSSGYTPNSISWESSLDGVAYTPISGANGTNYVSSALNDGIFYRAFINSGTNGCYSNVIEISVIDVDILTTQEGIRCGTGTVDLSATGTPGATLQWYANPTGGAALGTGNSFTTPSISSTTNFYVSASTGSAEEFVPSPTVGTSTFITSTLGWGLHFTVNSDVTIRTVDTYPVNGSSGPATIQIRITDLSDVVLFTGPVHNFTSSTTPSLQTVPVDITLPPGIYKMGMVYSGINNMVRESGGVVYPFTAPSTALSITAGANGSGSAQATTSYYWFYNWKLGSGCQSPRVAVEAEVIPTPVVQITPANTASVCAGDSVLLSFTAQPDVTYQWKRGGVDIPGATGATYYASISGAYTVEALNTTTNCASVSSQTQVNVLSPAAVITAAGPTTFCAGGSVSLSTPTSGTYLYQWSRNGINISPGGNLATYSATQSGTYRVTVTQFGCTAQSDSLVVTVNDGPIATVTPANSAVCENTPVTLQASTGTGYTYQWQDAGGAISGATSSSYTATSPGTYTVVITDGNSCSQTSSGAVVSYNASPVPVITANGLDLTATSGFVTYQWNLDGTAIPSATQAQYSAISNGSYTVTVTDANGCEGTSAVIQISHVSITEVDAVGGISVFPNPTSGIIQITSTSDVMVQVLSMDGKVLLSQNNVKAVDLSSFADNVYMVKVTNDTGKLLITKKIIKISK